MSYTYSHPNLAAFLVSELEAEVKSLALKLCVMSHRRVQASASVLRFGGSESRSGGVYQTTSVCSSAGHSGHAGPRPVRREEAREPRRERRTMVARDPGCYPV